jgi:hypothetical protein
MNNLMNSMEELKKELATKTMTVEWKVLCDIGPDWIGSSRKITFYLDKLPLENSEFSNFLIERLTDVMKIPSTSEDYVIKGNGKFILQGSELMIKYETEANIPYDDKFNFDNGTKCFLIDI